MKTKKLISLLLAVAMIATMITVVPIVVSADYSNTGSVITWDFAEYVDAPDVGENSASVEYNGLTIVGGASGDTLTTAGFRVNGSSSATTRYISYTPEADGVITVTFSSNNASDAANRSSAIGTSVNSSSPLDSKTADVGVLSASLTKGTEYYIYSTKSGQTYNKIVYEYTGGGEDPDPDETTEPNPEESTDPGTGGDTYGTDYAEWYVYTGASSGTNYYNDMKTDPSLDIEPTYSATGTSNRSFAPKGDFTGTAYSGNNISITTGVNIYSLKMQSSTYVTIDTKLSNSQKYNKYDLMIVYNDRNGGCGISVSGSSGTSGSYTENTGTDIIHSVVVPDMSDETITIGRAGGESGLLYVGLKYSYEERENVPVESVEIAENTAEVYVGSSIKLDVTVSPDNATNKGLIWTSSEDNSGGQVEISADGTITGKKAGTVTVTATSADNPGAHDSCVITVSDVVLMTDRGVSGDVNSLKAATTTTTYNLLQDVVEAGATSGFAVFGTNMLYYNNEILAGGNNGPLFYDYKTAYDLDGQLIAGGGLRLKAGQDWFAVKLTPGSKVRTYVTSGVDRYGYLTDDVNSISTNPSSTLAKLEPATDGLLEYTNRTGETKVVYICATGDSFIGLIQVEVPVEGDNTTSNAYAYEIPFTSTTRNYVEWNWATANITDINSSSHRREDLDDRLNTDIREVSESLGGTAPELSYYYKDSNSNYVNKLQYAQCNVTVYDFYMPHDYHGFHGTTMDAYHYLPWMRHDSKDYLEITGAMLDAYSSYDLKIVTNSRDMNENSTIKYEVFDADNEDPSATPIAEFDDTGKFGTNDTLTNGYYTEPDEIVFEGLKTNNIKIVSYSENYDQNKTDNGRSVFYSITLDYHKGTYESTQEEFGNALYGDLKGYYDSGWYQGEDGSLLGVMRFFQDYENAIDLDGYGFLFVDTDGSVLYEDNYTPRIIKSNDDSNSLLNRQDENPRGFFGDVTDIPLERLNEGLTIDDLRDKDYDDSVIDGSNTIDNPTVYALSYVSIDGFKYFAGKPIIGKIKKKRVTYPDSFSEK